MNAKELAALLNGREYLQEITDDEAKQAPAKNIVKIKPAMELSAAANSLVVK